MNFESNSGSHVSCLKELYHITSKVWVTSQVCVTSQVRVNSNCFSSLLFLFDMCLKWHTRESRTLCFTISLKRFSHLRGLIQHGFTAQFMKVNIPEYLPISLRDSNFFPFISQNWGRSPYATTNHQDLRCKTNF